MIELLIQMLYHSDLLVTTVALMSSQHAQVHNLRSVPMRFNFFEKKKKKKESNFWCKSTGQSWLTLLLLNYLTVEIRVNVCAVGQFDPHR